MATIGNKASLRWAILVGCLLTWSLAVGCYGQVGWSPQDPTADAGPNSPKDRKPPVRRTPDSGTDPTDGAVSDTPSTDQGTQDQGTQDQSTQDQGTNDGGCPPVKYSPLPNKVYFANVKFFLKAFCANCHGDTSKTGDILLYHLPSRGRTPEEFWKYVLSKIKHPTAPMPPEAPTKCDDIEYFKNGVKLFEAWANNGFKEKEGGGSTPTQVDPTVGNFPQANTCQGKEPLPARLWRLSDRQLRYVLADVFGTKTTLPKHPLVFQHNDGFDNNANKSLITGVDLVHMLQWLDPFSKSVIRNTAEFTNCTKATGTNCVKSLINKYGMRLFRRPVQTDELNKLTSSFQTINQKYGRNTALETVIERLILSPQTLYRSEVGTAVPGQPGMRKLTPYEVASFLSFTLWQSVPDSALLTAATQGKLGTLAQVKAQISRMSKSPMAQRGIFEFFYDWLQLDKLNDDAYAKDDKQFPQYTNSLRQSLLKENELLIADVAWKRFGTLGQLFTTNKTFANADVAKLYGMSSTSRQFTPVSTPAAERAGILTTPGFMAAHGKANSTGIVHRGLFVLIHMLCQVVGDPPAGATEAGDDKLKGRDQSKMTERTILDLKTGTGTCKSCHSQINPAGYAFENFDPIGRFRTSEKGGLPIDSSGSSSLVDQSAPAFRNGLEFIRKLAKSNMFRRCFTLKMYDYYLGTRAKAGQSCSVANIHDKMSASNFQLSKSYEALTTLSNFFMRKELQSTQP